MKEALDQGAASHAGGDGALGDEFEEADLLGIGNVGAATEFDRIGTDRQDPHGIAIFLSKQHHRAGFPGVLDRHQLGPGLQVHADLVVDQVLDLA